MYDDYNNLDDKPTTMPMYPRLPEVDDPSWRDVAVRSRTRNETSVRRFPVDTDGLDIAHVYVGDTIAIIPEVQFEYFVAARVGYHVGWINFKHVKLLSLKPSRKGNYLEDTRPDPPANHQERIARHREMQEREREAQAHYANNASYATNDADYEDDYYEEEETQPAYAERKPPPIPKKDVNRIIDKLKSLGGIFSRR